MIRKLGIVGLGLMGGSLGLAARRGGLARTVWGYARRAESREQAQAAGMVDRACAEPADAVRDAELVVFCLPVLAVPAVAATCVEELAAGCVVTDVGSTKSRLVEEMDRLLEGREARFVGSHPIAGSEQTGLAAARADLYAGAAVVVTRRTGEGDARDDAAHERVAAFWRGLGARVVVMGPEHHDRVLARTSHLPHLVAAMLVEAAGLDEEPLAAALCGSGFRDATRIAGGSDALWHDIVKTNRKSIDRGLAAFAEILARVRGDLARGDFDALREFLAANRARRQGLPAAARERPGPGQKSTR